MAAIHTAHQFAPDTVPSWFLILAGLTLVLFFIGGPVAVLLAPLIILPVLLRIVYRLARLLTRGSVRTIRWSGQTSVSMYRHQRDYRAGREETR